MALPFAIGLYLGEDQIRAVKLRRTNRGAVLQRMGSTPTPPGAMSGGVLHDVKLLSEAIRRVLKGYDISGNAAVLCLPGRASTSRILELPKMTTEELRPVVAGELEHYRMIPPGQGTFGFVSLGDTGTADSPQVRLLLMAADKRIVDSYREALRLAGLQMAALEPFSFAAARAVFPSLKKGSTTLLAVNARSTELLVFEEGALRYSRQIDIGTLDLTDPSSSVAKRSDTKDKEDEDSSQEAHLPRLDDVRGNLQSLIFEIQRSIDFYHRETDNAQRIQQIVLCADNESLVDFDKQLSDSLGLPVNLCDPLKHIRYNESQFNPGFLDKAGPGFAPAIGLALKALEEVPEAPSLDLSATGRESVLERAAPKRLTIALTVSLVLVIAAIASFLHLRGILHIQQNELAQTRAQLNEVAQAAEEKSEMARRVRDAQAIVQMRGLPWSDILFQVAEFMPERSWLTKISSTSASTLTLEGGAMSEGSVSDLMNSLRFSELFSMPKPTNMRKDANTSAVNFTVELIVTQPADIILPPEREVDTKIETAPPGDEE